MSYLLIFPNKKCISYENLQTSGISLNESILGTQITFKPVPVIIKGKFNCCVKYKYTSPNHLNIISDTDIVLQENKFNPIATKICSTNSCNKIYGAIILTRNDGEDFTIDEVNTIINLRLNKSNFMKTFFKLTLLLIILTLGIWLNIYLS